MYIYYNPNPVTSGAGDCVVRALCKALDMDWLTVYAQLCVEGAHMGEWGNANAVWHKYLISHGYTQSTLCKSYTVAQFAEEYPRGTYILATGTHVVTVSDGNIYDAFDSSQSVPIYYYYKKR